MERVTYEMDLYKAFRNISEIAVQAEREREKLSDVFHSVINCKNPMDITLEDIGYLIDNSRQMVNDFLLKDTGSYVRKQMGEISVDMNVRTQRRRFL